jgi:Domain of unknown function (DUF4331)
LLLTLTAAVFLCSVAPATASDHRDAPSIDSYSAIDITDVYMFRDPANCSPGPGCHLVVALATQAVADPMFGSSYHFQENALYRLNFTTRNDARPTAHIDFVFGPFGNGPDCPAPAPACQPFRAVFPGKTVIDGLATQGTAGATHLPPIVTTVGDIKVFAGPRQDPFFFDLVGFNRTVRSNPAAILFTGVDAFRDKNVRPLRCASGRSAPGRSDGKPAGEHDVDPRAASRCVQFRGAEGRSEGFRWSHPQSDPGVGYEGTCQHPGTTDPASCNPNVPLLTAVLVPDILRFTSDAPDGYPNGRLPSDRTSDLLIRLILNLSSFTDGTATKTYCPTFPFLRPRCN